MIPPLFQQDNITKLVRKLGTNKKLQCINDTLEFGPSGEIRCLSAGRKVEKHSRQAGNAQVSTGHLD